ncbi:TetR family transcriptional regulator [Micromonospora endolithica]|uniref:TetR family transcriptional regulator n=1 Tax=Micromonospora endolithica TaxID=230091 RepID=A0A3A9YWS9_9ACTN|nr:TetR family transcriptional regulator [Micromonospora endolithica]RKN40552.1 TetR family transcriptional regulator [Micromonospora endolithica]TWJ21623.1 TetR family transcriptional regulator [Micromonospora endolithica]
MTGTAPDDTRSRILRVALDLFGSNGYQRTSLRQIAERLRLTKTAILYHFPAKEDLLNALTEPLLADLESLIEATAALPPTRAREAMLTGWVDTLLAHRQSLGMLFHDLAMVARGTTYQRLMHIAMRANEIVAGPDAGRRERVRAVQSIAMVSDPVVFLVDVPEDVLRADMLDGVRRLWGVPDDAPPAEPAARRRPGRPRAMSAEQVGLARRLHAAGTHSVDEIAATLGVSRATVYRHLVASGPSL